MPKKKSENKKPKTKCRTCGQEVITKKEKDIDSSGLSRGARKAFADTIISLIHPGY